ncbi:hypothetical protein [Staphylococcus saprophyticus]|uniref:hypothetical protein n=1 Tax=Staphylococcus saprophyticus TaxID=29385 RepID=UPI0034CE9EAC
MNDDIRKAFINEKNLGVKILSWFYLVIIFILYGSIYCYIQYSNSIEIASVQSLIILIVTTIGGNYSKQFYFNLVSLIIYHNETLETVVMKKWKAIVDTIVNYITLILLQVYVMQVVENIYFTIAGFTILVFLSISAVIAQFFKISSYDEYFKD